MGKPKLLALILGVLIASAMGVTALVQRSPAAQLETPLGSPNAALDLLYARAFTLQRSYPYAWRAEQPPVDSGWLLVIQVDPARCVPSQEYEPVLYVGSQTAERINTGQGSGRIVAVVPAGRGADGEPDLDLNQALVFFGAPRLPEQVDARVVASELTHARSAKIAPLPAERIVAAREAGGSPVDFEERDELIRLGAQLILQYAPQETEFAHGLLVPRMR